MNMPRSQSLILRMMIRGGREGTMTTGEWEGRRRWGGEGRVSHNNGSQ